MKQTKRFLLQVALWMVLWIILWFFEGISTQFLKENLLVYTFQIILLAGLIYYAAPVLLLNKKYSAFFILSVSSILISCFILSYTNVLPDVPPMGNRGPRFDDLPPDIPNIRKPISKFFVNFLIISISVVIGIFLETLIFAQKKEEETIKNLNEKLETELKLLKSQINPHFLFNTLNNIYALSAIDTVKTQESISYLSDMLRYVLYECEQPTVPLNKEIDYIKNYIKLFAVKSSKKYPITTSFDIENRNTPIAPMLLIPFVENAFKHSTIEKIEGAFIHILVKEKDNEIYFEVENSTSNSAKQKDAVGGIGLSNVKKRLEIVYSNSYTLDIQNNEQSFKVKLRLKLS